MTTLFRNNMIWVSNSSAVVRHYFKYVILVNYVRIIYIYTYISTGLFLCTEFPTTLLKSFTIFFSQNCSKILLRVSPRRPNFFFHFFFVYGGENKECIALKFYGFTMNTRVLLTGDTRAGEFSKVLQRVDTVEHYNNNCKKKNYHLTVQ